MRHLAALLLPVLVAGCASSQWQKTGTDAAAIEADIKQCEEQANLYANRLASSGIGDKPAVSVSPRGQVGVIRPPSVLPPMDPVAEDNYFRSCMRDRGYSRYGVP